MPLAQELPPVEVIVESSPDLLSVIVSVVAVAIALASVAVTWRQGREIRNIETREHEWQAEDRVSAHIEVTRISETHPRTSATSLGVKTLYSTSELLRLRNTGRAPARNVVWSLDVANVLMNERDSLDVLYPGEHYDLTLVLSSQSDTHFTVTWTDGNGEHETTRLINL